MNIIPNDKPLVTIGIPTFNRAHNHLTNALESAIKQTYRNIEIIVSDNCSSDNTEEVVRSYDDQRIRYYRQTENIGPWKNMNFCLHNARGNYFLMLHDDDIIDRELIEKCIEHADYQVDKGIIIAGAREIDMNGNTITEKQNLCNGLSAYEFILEWYKKRVLLFQNTILFNKEKMIEFGGFDEYYRYFADVAIEFKMIANTTRVDVPDILGSFRANEGSLGKKAKIAQWCDDSLKILDLACSLVGCTSTNGTLRIKGLETSSERMYRYATFRTFTITDWLLANFTVWKKFNYRYYPPKKYVYSRLPFLKYFLSPRLIIKKLSRVFTEYKI